LPAKLYRCARHEYRKVKRLQKLLHRRPDIIIRRVDEGEGFYFGNKSIIEYKTEEYMKNTEAYQEVTTGRCPLADIFRSTEAVLDYLDRKKVISKVQRDKLLLNVNTVEFAHLYTLSEVHKPQLPIRPIVSSLHAPGTLVPLFLYHLLLPIYLQVAHDTTFINSIDVVRKLKKYAADGYLKPTTKFITGDVENLYTMIPRERGINVLTRFLEKYSKSHKIGPLTI
ncbi:unnamed protein product, partial [Rotaria sp. Silwood1]